jgi:hypothetical protein
MSIAQMAAMNRTTVLAIGCLAVLAAGCRSNERPSGYAKQRPDVSQIDSRDAGLQSKDVVDASDQLAMDLLSRPELNASKEQWQIVVTGVKNDTTDAKFNYDIFTERLRVNLARHGRGRVALIENKERYRELQSREVENEVEGGQAVAPPAGVQPDFALYGRIMEMPNRGTSYYFAEFNLTDLRTREQIWSGAYEVKVAR